MDPYTEQRLRDEVIYLHSLWHHGHPGSLLRAVNLQPSNSTRFKKPKKKSNARKKVGSFSGKEWPVGPLPADPPLTESGWPELKVKPKPQPSRLPTPEELQKYHWNQVQQRALKAAKEFYSENTELSDDEDDDNDYGGDDDMTDDGDNVDDKVHDFFWEMFNGDEELKAYYGKHCSGGGEFSCLVCGGANEKHGKRFKDCIALVQHSVSIAKTKRRRSHRAYGKVICKVLGWEINCLPSSIVSDQKCSELQGKDVDVHKYDNDLNNVMDGGNSNGKTSEVAANVDGESMVCEDISGVTNLEEEDSMNLALNEAEGCTGGAVKNLCRNLSSGMVLEPVPSDLQSN